MGNTYANVTVVGTTGPAVVEALAGTDAFVADAGDGCVVVFAAADAARASNPVFVSDLHAQLAKALDLPPWAAAHGWGHLDDGESEIPVELVRTP
jgi:hypothetical protein